MTSDTTGEIAKALAEFQAEMPSIAKGKTADTGTYSYSYADLADITALAMPLLSQHGLAFSTCPKRGEHGYDVVGLLLHTSGERLEGALPLHGNQPQQIGSALTYARRYLLCSMTGLVTDDDDDGRAAQNAPRTEPKMQPKTRGRLFALFTQKGIEEPFQLTGINQIAGADYTSRADVTEAHAKEVIAVLEQRPDAPLPDAKGGA